MASPPVGRTDRVNILVVDDRPAKLIAMEALLADLGENVVCVGSGAAALRQLLDREFALILLDVNMPDMDGFEAAALIRQRPRLQHIPIIFMTAGSDDTHALQGYSLGAVDYILTPVVPEVLRTKVKVFVELFKMTEQLKRQAEERVALAEEQARRAAAEAANLRAVFLGDAGKSMVRSLDLETTANTILGLMVPDFGDFAMLRLSAADGDTVHVRHGDASGATAHAETSLSASMERAIRSLGSQLLTDSGGGAAVVRGVACPLHARGTTLGVLAVAVGKGRGPYDPVRIMMVEELSARAALAIDNCLLYREIEQRDLRKEQFVAMLAHELRNPLGAITSALGVLERVGGDPADRARGVIRRQLENLTHLVDDLLDVSRITTGKISLNRSTVNLAESVERCLKTLEAGERIAGHVIRVQSEAAWVEADSVRIDQILVNLLGNALKYTPAGGSIDVRVRPEGDDSMVEITDTGVGMSQEALAHAFDLFFQADRAPERTQGGLGIGLSLARQLVELHGGSVQAASDGEGCGSRFTVRFPRSAPPVSDHDGVKVSGHEMDRSRILLVEDNEDAREMLQMLLTLAGHEVYGAGDGPTGIEMALALVPDIVVIDLGLPGVDGYEVARQLRARRKNDVGLIALSGYGQADDRRKALEAGFDTHIVKPADPSLLLTVIASLQRGRPSPSRRTPP
jgi:signal transduction histidine kinase/DNA-binding response OmpR family regulator